MIMQASFIATNDAATGATGDRKMKKYTITLDLVTPCISSGAEKMKAEFRAPSIRGALRHWFRVLGGTRENEEKIFGGISTGSPIRSSVTVRVVNAPTTVEDNSEAWENLKEKSFAYFLGVLSGKDSARAYFSENQTAEIQIIDKSENPAFEKALLAWLLLGSIGLRSRRCFGSIYPQKIEIEEGGNMRLLNIPQTTEEFKEYLKNESGLKNAVVLSLGNSTNSASGAMTTAQDYLQKFRKGNPPVSKPSPEAKAAIGLPFKNFKVKARWASPVCLKVVPLNGDYVSIAIFLKDYFLTDDKLPQNQHVSHELIKAMMDVDQVKRRGIGNAQKLFPS